ncbi:MAG: hypothetical protein K2X93_23000 [Candidatus Obscuribacterales bacterium]|nr:hypothetical protein [Candidatus Obscuribacterales bacterium]
MQLPKAIARLSEVVHHEDRTHTAIEAFEVLLIKIQEWCPHKEVKAVGKTDVDDDGKVTKKPNWYCQYCGARFFPHESANMLHNFQGES